MVFDQVIQRYGIDVSIYLALSSQAASLLLLIRRFDPFLNKVLVFLLTKASQIAWSSNEKFDTSIACMQAILFITHHEQVDVALNI